MNKVIGELAKKANESIKMYLTYPRPQLLFNLNKCEAKNKLASTPSVLEFSNFCCYFLNRFGNLWGEVSFLKFTQYTICIVCAQNL